MTAGGAVVLDCSVVTDLLVGPDHADVEAAVSEATWHAPALLDIEVVSALRGLVLGRHLSMPRARDALGDYDTLGITRWDLEASARVRALELAQNLTAYDAAYVVLAEAMDWPLLTRDRGLAAAAARLVEVDVL